jgi:hypothetical protein
MVHQLVKQTVQNTAVKIAPFAPGQARTSKCVSAGDPTVVDVVLDIVQHSRRPIHNVLHLVQGLVG